MKNLKTEKRLRRKSKIKNRIRGTKEMPRLTVYRSNKHIYAQLIDDSIGKTIVAASDAKVKKGSATEKAISVGADIAKAALAKKVKKVRFDRNGYKYHGRVKALADAARGEGLSF